MIGGEAPLIFNYSHDGEGRWSTMLLTAAAAAIIVTSSRIAGAVA
jgi:hypothetical protein